jgi:hypothetical protein
VTPVPTLSPSAASDSLFGNINAAQPLQPGDAFTELADTALANLKISRSSEFSCDGR